MEPGIVRPKRRSIRVELHLGLNAGIFHQMKTVMLLSVRVLSQVIWVRYPGHQSGQRTSTKCNEINTAAFLESS